MADKTKDQVRELLGQNKSAKEIAAELGKTPATIYNHIANIRKESGDTTPRKRGRPPKLQNQDQGKTESKTPTKPKTTPAAQNGSGHLGERFPLIRSAIEEQLNQARRDVVTLEKMLADA